jgi:hypothetical protein
MPRAVADVESDGSEDLEDLPGPDEFLQTAVRELTQRRTPEFGRPSGRANATNRAGPPRAGANAGSGTEDETDDATTTYDDYERSAIDEFLATSAPPAPASVATSAASPGGRKNSPGAPDPIGRASDAGDPSAGEPLSPKQRVEQLTTTLKLEHQVTEAVVDAMLEEALLRTAYPDQIETPMMTAPTSPEPSVRGDDRDAATTPDANRTATPPRASPPRDGREENGRAGGAANEHRAPSERTPDAATSRWLAGGGPGSGSGSGKGSPAGTPPPPETLRSPRGTAVRSLRSPPPFAAPKRARRTRGAPTKSRTRRCWTLG